MRTFNFTLTFIFLIGISFISTAQDCVSLKMRTAEEVKAAETCILRSSDFILNTVLNKQGIQAVESRKAVILWMEKTSYSFTLTGATNDITKNNTDLFGVFLACLAKATIENNKVSEKEAINLYANYVKNEKNGVKITGKLKKFLKDIEKGNFSKYLN